MEYLKLLNPEQAAAVEATEGPVIIIAGAGSGKTRVLTYRVAHLLDKGVDPFHILALTFTNKAAREMRNRIEKIAGTEARNLWMGTFHSVFAKMLRSDAHLLGYPRNFTIYDTDDSKSLIKSIIKELALDDKIYKPSTLLSRFSSAKNNLIGPDSYSSDADLIKSDEIARRSRTAEIFSIYQQRCFRAGAMDFDDLLYNTNVILHTFPDVLLKYQHLFRYILVDEYQDTNYSQYIIIRKLAAVHQNICVVGDDSQSIYAFRGASIQNILNFKKDYSETLTFKLEQNYRSSGNIIKAAETVINNNKNRLDKKIWTKNNEGEKIHLIRAVSDNEEGKLVAESIFAEKMSKQLHHADFAILYRTNSQSRSFEEALRKLNIPYKVVGGTSFYQRKEIKDLLAYLRLTANPNDEEALKRIINYPARGIGDTSLNKIIALAHADRVSIWHVIEHSEKYPELRAALKNITVFRDLILSFIALNVNSNAFEMASHIAKKSGILKVLYDDKSVEGVARYENIEELLSGIEQFVEEDELTMLDAAPSSKDLSQWLQNVSLLTDADEKDKDQADKVQLMTIHSSKGLEFPHLYVAGLEENLFPSQMSLSSREELEEERRLFYVALTRAMQRLTLSYATSRFRFGSLNYCEPSRFLREIDSSLIQNVPSHQSPFSSKFAFQHSDTFFGFGSKPGSTKESTIPFSRSKPTPGNPIGKIIPKNAKPPVNVNFVAGDISTLKVDSRVEHQRFGTGSVVSIEGTGEGKNAVILFDNYGEKKIILKFAKLRICE